MISIMYDRFDTTQQSHTVSYSVMHSDILQRITMLFCILFC